jgi:seryl-tRNA synthetase
MGNLKNFKTFLEKYNIDGAEPLDIQNKMAQFNQIEEFINGYNSDKSKVDNAFKKENNEEIYRQLKSDRLVDDKHSFINPILAIYAQIVRINKEIDNQVVMLNTANDDLNLVGEQKNEKDVDQSELSKKESDIKQRISDIQSKINDKKKEITDCEKSASIKLNSYKKDLVNIKKAIDDYHKEALKG